MELRWKLRAIEKMSGKVKSSFHPAIHQRDDDEDKKCDENCLSLNFQLLMLFFSSVPQSDFKG